MNYGQRIKELRVEANMTQAQLATLAKITQPQLSNIETGEIGLTVKTADKICAALGITLPELFEA